MSFKSIHGILMPLTRQHIYLKGGLHRNEHHNLSIFHLRGGGGITQRERLLNNYFITGDIKIEVAALARHIACNAFILKAHKRKQCLFTSQNSFVKKQSVSVL